MKQRKLRGYVLPALYVLILMLVFGAVSLVSTLLKSNPGYLYSIGILNNNTVPVVDVEGKVPMVVIKPYVGDTVEIANTFYDIKDEAEEQEKSLIYYQNTYMKNTGILYTSKDTFDVVMVLDGEIVNVKDDDILGKVVEVQYNTDLRAIYYSLDEVLVKVGDKLLQGEIIGKGGSNSISNAKYNLLFEVYYKGALIDPEEFYKMDVGTLD